MFCAEHPACLVLAQHCAACRTGYREVHRDVFSNRELTWPP